jgi:hypothetical protein
MSIRSGLMTALLAIGTSSALRAQTAKPPMLGVWQGVGVVVVPWLHERTIPVSLTIMANDSVSGTVGDATLVGARFARRDTSNVGTRWKTEYIITGNLTGPVVRIEGIWRPGISILLNWNGADFIGGFATSGWRVGSIEYRAVEASLILHQRVVSVATGSLPVVLSRR